MSVCVRVCVCFFVRFYFFFICSPFSSSRLNNISVFPYEHLSMYPLDSSCKTDIHDLFFSFFFRLWLHTYFCYAARATSRDIVIPLPFERERGKGHKRSNQVCAYMFYDLTHDNCRILFLNHICDFLIHTDTRDQVDFSTREPQLVVRWNHRPIKLRSRETQTATART